MYSVFENNTHFGLQPATLGYTALPPTCIEPGMSARSLEINVSKISGAAEQSVSDRVAIEEPLEIRLGYSTSDGRTATSISITMRTPGHDAELATGFLFSESIIKRLQDVESVQPCGPPAPDSGNHNIVRVELASDVQVDLGRLQRHFYTTSSCGVCGKSSLDALRVTGVERGPDGGTRFAREISRYAQRLPNA